MVTFKVFKVVGQMKTQSKLRGTERPTYDFDSRTVLLLAQNFVEAVDNAHEALEHNWSQRVSTSTIHAITPVVNERSEQLEVRLSERSFRLAGGEPEE